MAYLFLHIAGFDEVDKPTSMPRKDLKVTKFSFLKLLS